eukprot:TRINITY_DN5449_c0_g1_i2.p1 TRINITY_DN5449_c0_g1~~TRINITY_DN5449_c0_g1_i2.p1  ORF type:complete len:286 (-),score=40.86 TRINITY_DN5449_c0_g1_i2:228-1085(-)
MMCGARMYLSLFVTPLVVASSLHVSRETSDASSPWVGLDADFASDASRPLLQIAGMYDSGSNLMESLIDSNIPADTFRYSLFGKHRSPRRLAELLNEQAKLLDGQRVVVAAIVRSPLAQIAGWIKAPYDFRSQIEGMNLLHDQKTLLTIPRNGGSFWGFTGLWNGFTKGYADFDKHPNRSVVIVEYERLVYDPQPVLREIASALGTALVQDFQAMDEPAKEHGHPKGRELALEEIVNMTYLHKPPLSDVNVRRALCNKLDKDTLKRHIVPGPNGPRSYAADCEFL